MIVSGSGARFELILTGGDRVQIRNTRDVVLVMTGFWVVVLVVVVVVVVRTDGVDSDPLLQQTLKTTFMWWELHLPADSEGPADNEIK